METVDLVLVVMVNAASLCALCDALGKAFGVSIGSANALSWFFLAVTIVSGAMLFIGFTVPVRTGLSQLSLYGPPIAMGLAALFIGLKIRLAR